MGRMERLVAKYVRRDGITLNTSVWYGPECRIKTLADAVEQADGWCDLRRAEDTDG